MENGMMELQALPSYIIRKTRPPRQLGSLFIVIRMVQDESGLDKKRDLRGDDHGE